MYDYVCIYVCIYASTYVSYVLSSMILAIYYMHFLFSFTIFVRPTYEKFSVSSVYKSSRVVYGVATSILIVRFSSSPNMGREEDKIK